MSINEGTYGEFANELQDEDQLDAHPPPGIEIGYQTQRDCGSGSYAEDGRREVREDRPIMDGEHVLGSAAMYGPTEIGGIEDEDALGAVKQAVQRAAQAVKRAVVAKKTAPPQVAAKHAAVAHRAVAAAEHAVALGPYALSGATEIGAGLYPVDGASELGSGWAAAEGQSEVGYAPYAAEGATELGAGEDTLGNDALTQPFETFMLEPHRIGCEVGEEEVGTHYPTQGASEVGWEDYGQVARRRALARARREGYRVPVHVLGDEDLGAAACADRPGHEIGSAAMYGPTEIGALYPTNGLSEMGEDELGEDDLGAGWYAAEGASEIGEEEQKAAIVKVVEKARNNRQPAPPMKAVDVDDPLWDEENFLSAIVLGATVAAPGAAEPFPLLTQLLLRAGANVEPRIVRVDTEESYKQFRTSQSPALSNVKDLSDRLEAHIADPNAHELDSEDIDDDIADLVHLGEEAKAVEAQKRVDLWMPKRFDGKLEAWRQDDMVCASLALPGRDGEVRICTSFEPVSKCVEEMCRHAAETQVPAATVVGVLPAMGCVLGAGTVLKEIAAAAPAILARPEAQVKLPFVVRIEPKTSPNLAALVMLAAAAKMGNAQAVSEWQKLASMSAPAVKLAMLEAAEVAKAATEV